MYVERRICQSEYISVNGLKYHVRIWSEASHPTLFMLHGWMDISASFQFIVDEMHRGWRIVAPDWRGFGETEWSTPYGGAVAYHMLDMTADLDAIIRHFEPKNQIKLIGHSMGSNIACLYAGVRSAKIQKLVSLEGLGSSFIEPKKYPERFAKWLDDLQTEPRLLVFDTLEDVARQLQKDCSGLTDNRAIYLAAHWTREGEQGKRILRADPRHKYREPGRYPAEEIISVWRSVVAPLLHVQAQCTEEDGLLGLSRDMSIVNKRISMFSSYELKTIKNSCHRIHLDQPKRVAELIEDFFDWPDG